MWHVARKQDHSDRAMLAEAPAGASSENPWSCTDRRAGVESPRGCFRCAEIAPCVRRSHLPQIGSGFGGLGRYFTARLAKGAGRVSPGAASGAPPTRRALWSPGPGSRGGSPVAAKLVSFVRPCPARNVARPVSASVTSAAMNLTWFSRQGSSSPGRVGAAALPDVELHAAHFGADAPLEASEYV